MDDQEFWDMAFLGTLKKMSGNIETRRLARKAAKKDGSTICVFISECAVEFADAALAARQNLKLKRRG